MDYVKSSDWELGTGIKHREWVEGTEIRYQRSDIGVGMGSNRWPLYLLARFTEGFHQEECSIQQGSKAINGSTSFYGH